MSCRRFDANCEEVQETCARGRLWHRNIIFTVDPQNIQTALALKFKDFGVGSARVDAPAKKFKKPVLGAGFG
jgi:hypothetical protein